MKKGNMLVGVLAFCTAALSAIAFTTNSPAGNLYYFNNEKNCVAAPCETVNNSNKACLVGVYSDSNCRTVYKGNLWATDGDQ